MTVFQADDGRTNQQGMPGWTVSSCGLRENQALPAPPSGMATSDRDKFYDLSLCGKKILVAAGKYVELLGPVRAYWWFLYAFPYTLCSMAESDQARISAKGKGRYPGKT